MCNNCADPINAYANMDAVDRALHNERNDYSSFNADFDPSPETIAIVHNTFDYIEANPDEWNQESYGNHLTATNCFMGLVNRLNGLRTSRLPWYEDNGEKPEDFMEYSLSSAMDILEMGGYEYTDRASYIAEFIDAYDFNTCSYRHPTLDEMYERVSIALNHDFRKKDNN